MIRAVHLVVTGEVQGVGYRYFAEAEANRRRLAGWVRNLRDGRVEGVGEGDEAALHEWIAALRRGPSAARVETLLPVFVEPQGLRGFEVRATAAAEARPR